MRQTVRQLVTDPRAAVDSGWAVDHPVVGRPAVILFGLGALSLGSMIVPTVVEGCDCLLTGDMMTFAIGDATVAFSRSMVMIAGLILVAPFLFCLAVTAVTSLAVGALQTLGTARRRGLSRPTLSRSATATFGRRQGQTFVRTYALVAVGFFPQFVATLLSGAVLAVAILSGMDSSSGMVRLTPAGHMLLFLDGVPAVKIFTHAVGVLATLASGSIWVGAVSRGRGVSLRLATAVVVPVTLLLIYLSDLVGHL